MVATRGDYGRVQVEKLQVFANVGEELQRFNENLVRAHVSNAHLDQVGVVGELNARDGIEGLQCLKLELLVVGFDDVVLLQIQCIVSASELTLIRVHVLHLIPAQLGHLLHEVLRLVLKLDKHAMKGVRLGVSVFIWMMTYM